MKTWTRRLVVALSGIALATPAAGQVVRQLTDERTAIAGPGSLDDAGTVVFSGTSADVSGANPRHTFQIVRFDPVSGVATQITDAPEGVSALVSVSDDGQWLAFVSPADLTGQNHDESLELFVMSADGSTIDQLTDDPAPNAGSVGVVAICGDGSRIAFVANTDPLGTNADGLEQLFVIGRDGSGLTQLTAVTAATGGGFGAVSISDDGARLAFAHDGDLTGQNPDLGSEVFAIEAGGANLRQLTSSPAGFGSRAPALCGNGQRIAFESDADLTGGNAANQSEIFVVDWTGSPFQQLTTTTTVLGIAGDPASQSPAITDDGNTVFFHSNHSRLFPPLNIDGNFEIFRIQSNGAGLTALTSTLLQAGSFLPVVSGNGQRVAYYGIDTQVDLRVIDGAGGSALDLLTFEIALNGQQDVSPDGARAVFVRSTGLFGGDQLWRVDVAGGAATQVTSLSSGSASSPSIAADDSTIVFSADSNPDGISNDDLSEEIFRVQADGSGLVQITSGPAGTSSQNPVIASDGSLLVFDSDADLTGANVDLSREVFAVAPDGSGPLQLTSGPAGTTSRLPRVDASGGVVVFESNADLDGTNPDGSYEVWRVPAAGGAVQAVTADPLLDSRSPDVSAAGDRIVFGTGSQVFAFEVPTATTTQLTTFGTGSSGNARISGNGAWVVFSSDAPVFESDPDSPSDLYRIPFAGGAIERIGALRTAGAGAGGVPVPIGVGSTVAVDDSGAVTVYSALGDSTGGNPDLLTELWAIDRTAAPRLDVGKPAPTETVWLPESGPLRYDVIRGDLAQIAAVGGAIDLGPVVCIENDSPDADTIGFGDPLEPAPGQVLIFLYRGSQGLLAGPGSYGSAGDGRVRQTGSGDCAP